MPGTGIEIRELIITCEACGNVKRYSVKNQEECERIFNEFQCFNNCGRNLYSYITVGVLHREQQQENPAPRKKELVPNIY